jgi:hypothetical protein
MTQSQQHAVAVGFLHILQAHQDVYERWIVIPKDDMVAIGALIQQEVGLAQAPEAADLQAMADYVDAHLKDQTAAIQSANSDAPKHVGFVVATQQS